MLLIRPMGRFRVNTLLCSAKFADTAGHYLFRHEEEYFFLQGDVIEPVITMIYHFRLAPMSVAMKDSEMSHYFQCFLTNFQRRLKFFLKNYLIVQSVFLHFFFFIKNVGKCFNTFFPRIVKIESTQEQS